MNWKPWAFGLVALGVFDAALVLGVKAYWRHQTGPSLDPAKSSSPVVPAAPVQFTSSVPKPLQEACVAGTKWLYDDVRQRWFKPLRGDTGLPLSCNIGTVRSENDREGLIVRHPKGWQPSGG